MTYIPHAHARPSDQALSVGRHCMRTGECGINASGDQFVQKLGVVGNAALQLVYRFRYLPCFW